MSIYEAGGKFLSTKSAFILAYLGTFHNWQQKHQLSIIQAILGEDTMARAGELELVRQFIADPDMYDHLLNFTAVRLNSRSAAHDVTQEAIVRALVTFTKDTKGETYRLNIRSWFFRTIRNIIIDNYRREKIRQRTFHTDSDRIETPEDLEELYNTAPTAPSAEEQFFSLHTIQLVVEQLRPREAEIVLLIAEGYSYSEIGEKLGLHPQAVKSTVGRLHKRMKALKDQLLVHG